MPDYALVVFSNDTDMWWLRGLKRGFRHCFILVKVDGVWVSIDPLAHKTDVFVLKLAHEHDITSWLRSEGCTLLRVSVHDSAPRALWPALHTCVESVKRILGLRCFFIFTPWQLYRFLSRTCPHI